MNLLPTPNRADPETGNESPSQDRWAEWVLKKRNGGDSQFDRELKRQLFQIRDRVLDGAGLSGAATLLDIGCGDGLVGLGALERMGCSGRVVFLDLSQRLLAVAEQAVADRGWRGRSEFVLGSAEKLAGVAEGAADVVTTRACLAYIADKAAAVREIRRVLRPGGRVSLGEPIFRDQSLQITHLVETLRARPSDEATAHLRLVMRWKAAQFPSTRDAIVASPLTNFSEWDLVRLFQEAGFSELHLELHIDVRKTPAMPWETFLSLAPHPLAPTLREVLKSEFSPEEAGRLEAVLRPSVESGREMERNAVAYLTAVRP
jgi:ubiquinone/menaquinone biosynthesis C-methylase UbiE